MNKKKSNDSKTLKIIKSKTSILDNSQINLSEKNLPKAKKDQKEFVHSSKKHLKEKNVKKSLLKTGIIAATGTVAVAGLVSVIVGQNTDNDKNEQQKDIKVSNQYSNFYTSEESVNSAPPSTSITPTSANNAITETEISTAINNLKLGTDSQIAQTLEQAIGQNGEAEVFGTFMIQSVDDQGNITWKSSSPSFLSQLGLKLNNVDSKYPPSVSKFIITKIDDQNIQITASTSISVGSVSKSLDISSNAITLSSQISEKNSEFLFNHYKDSSTFSLNTNKENAKYLPFVNPFNGGSNFENLINASSDVYKDYDLVSVTDWHVVGTSTETSKTATVTLKLELKSTPDNASLKNNPSYQTINIQNVNLNYLSSANDWAETLLNNAVDNATFEQNSLKFPNEQDYLFSIYDQDNSVTTLDSHIDRTITPMSDNSKILKKYNVTYKANFFSSDGTLVFSKTKDAIWTFNLAKNTQEYLQYQIQNVNVDLKDSLKNGNYLNFTMLTGSNLNISNQPSDIAIEKVEFLQPSVISSNEAKISVTWKLNDASVTSSNTISQVYDVRMTKTTEELELQEFIDNFKTSADTSFDVTDPNAFPPLDSTGINSWITYLDNNAQLNNQPINIQNQIDNFGKSSPVNLTFTYVYSDRNSQVANLTIHFRHGSAPAINENYTINFPQSFNNNVMQNVLNIQNLKKDLKVNSSFLSNHTINDISNGPVLSDLSFANQTNNVNLEIVNYTPPSNPDNVQGSLNVKFSYSKDVTLNKIINVPVNFTASINQLKTDQLPDQVALESRNNSNHKISEDLNFDLTNSNPFANFLPQGSPLGSPGLTFDASSFQQVKSLDFNNEKFQKTYQIDVAVGNANSKTITFIADLDTNSQYFANYLLNNITISASTALKDNADFQFRNNNQNFSLTSSDFQNYFKFNSPKSKIIFSKYFDVENNEFTLQQPIQPDDTRGTLNYALSLKSSGLNLGSQSISFDFSESLNALNLKNVPNEINSFALDKGLDQIWNNTTKIPSAAEVQQIKDFMIQNGVDSKGLTKVEFKKGSVTQVKTDQTADHFYLTQTAKFTVFYGQSHKDVTLHFFVKVDSNDYIKKLLSSNFFKFSASSTLINSESWSAGLQEQDLEVIHNNQVIPVGNILNYGTPTNNNAFQPTISVRMVSEPSKDSSSASFSFRVNSQSSTNISFNFASTPNQIAIKEAFSGTHPSILPSKDYGTDQIPQTINLGKKDENNNVPIADKIPASSVLGFDSNGNIANLALLTQWLESNTDISLHNFSSALKHTTSAVRIDEVHLTGATFSLNEKQADQTFVLTFTSGQETKTVNLQLHFAKSPYQVQREEGIQNWNQDNVIQSSYLNTDDFHALSLNNPQDLKIQTLNSENYQITAVKNYQAPTGDSQIGHVTFTIKDNDPNGASAVQDLDITIHFAKSPNQVKTNQLSNTYNVNSPFSFQFDSFNSNLNTTDAIFQNAPWPSNLGKPTISKVTLVDSDSFSELFKVSIVYGNANAKDIYFQGNLNHKTLTYLQNATKDSTLKLDSKIVDNNLKHQSGQLSQAQLLASQLFFKSLPSDASSQTISSTSTQNGLIFKDINIDGISITEVKSNTGKAQVNFSILDNQNQKITLQKVYSFNFKFSKNVIDLNVFDQNVVNSSVLTLNNSQQFPSSPRTLGSDSTTIYNWLTQNTNLSSLEQQWKIPAGATILNAQFSVDLTSKEQIVHVSYQNGLKQNGQIAKTPTFDFKIVFAKSPNQDELDNLSQSQIVNPINNYLNQKAYEVWSAPTKNQFTLDPRFEISSATSAISNYVGPTTANDTNAHVDVIVQNKNDASATRTVTVNFNFSHSLNSYRTERVKSYGRFELSPYDTRVPSDTEAIASNQILNHAVISNIQEINFDAQNDPDAKHVYTADLQFGTESKFTIQFYRPENPLKQMLKEAVKNYTFDFKDFYKNLPESDAQKALDYSNFFKFFSIIDNQGNSISAFPSQVTLDTNSFVYTAPQDNDSTQAGFTFNLIYTGETANWTKTEANGNVLTLRGSTDPNSPGYLGDHGFTKTAGSEQNESVSREIKIDFNYTSSQNYYDLLNKFITPLQKDYGKNNSIGSQTPILNFAPTTLGADTQSQLTWLTQNTNFTMPTASSQVQINSLHYTQSPDSKIATINLEFQKGQTKLSTSIQLHFAITYNQDYLNGLRVTDIVNSINSQYLTVAHETIGNLDSASFSIHSPFEIVGGVQDFVGVSNNDGHSGSVKLTIRNKNDHNATRDITVPLTFVKSINENKIDQISQQHQYQVDPFWQNENDPIPTNSSLKTFLTNKLIETAQINSQLKDADVQFSNVKALQSSNAKLINSAAKIAWSVDVQIGNAGPLTIVLWQRENPLKTNYEQIMQDLDWNIDAQITNAWNQSFQTPTINNITFSKNGQTYNLPNDITSSQGVMSFKVVSVDLPQGSDEKTATIHYEATFQLRDVQNKIHTYLKKGLSTSYDYLYSKNGLDIQSVLHGFGNITNNHVDIGTDSQTLDIVAPASLDEQSIGSFFDNKASLRTSFTQMLNNANLTTQNLNISYASNNQRDVTKANQRLHLIINKGQSSYDLDFTLHFAKSYNQNLLDNKSVEDLFGSAENRDLESSYVHITKNSPPSVSDIHLKDSRYQVVSVNSNSFLPPDTDNGLRSSQFKVTVQDRQDSKVTREILVTFKFDTIGFDVGSITQANVQYSINGNITLPDGQVRVFNANDPAINGFSTLNVTSFIDKQNRTLQLPAHTKLEYKVIDANTKQVVQAWSDQKPVTLLNGQAVVLRLVTNDKEYTIENANEITLNAINTLVTGVTIPNNFQWTTATYTGYEGRGTIVVQPMSKYFINYQTPQSGAEKSNIHYVFTVTRNGNKIHDKEVASQLSDLKVNDKVSVNVVVNDTNTHILLNTPAQDHYIGKVTGLKIAPTVDLNDLALITNRSDGTKGHHGFANGRLSIKKSASSGAKKHGAFPASDEHWKWSYEVRDSNDQIISAASDNPPTNLKNGQHVIIKYAPKNNFNLPDDFKNRSQDFEIKGLLYEITLPNDIQPKIPYYVGHEGSGTFSSLPTNEKRYTAHSFAHQEHIVVEYRVEDFEGNLKADWSKPNEINNLKVHDKVYARYVVDDAENYILMNPIAAAGVFVNGVTNLEITPRINPINLSASVVGVQGRANIQLFEGATGQISALPKINDFWHWQYKTTKTGSNTIIDDWSDVAPVALQNGFTVHVRVAANADYKLDSIYQEFTLDVKNLKTEINVSNLTTPVFEFSGFLGEGRVAAVKNNQGNKYQIPAHTKWEFYLEKNDISAKNLQNDLNDDSKWTSWDNQDISKLTSNLSVNDRFHLRLKVTDEQHYVLSEDFVPPPIIVKGLEINPANIRAHYSAQTFQGEGSVSVNYRDPDTHYSPQNPFIQNDDESAVAWEIKVVRTDGTTDDYQAITNIQNLSNGDHVYIRTVPISSQYKMTNPVEYDFVIDHLFIKVSSEGLYLKDFKLFYAQDDKTKTAQTTNLGNLIDGEVGLLPPNVFQKQTGSNKDKDVTNNLPAGITLKYKYISADQDGVNFNDSNIPILDNPPSQGIRNDDQIMVFLMAENPQIYKLSSKVSRVFTVKGLSPLPPNNLTPEFDYNNHIDNPGVDGRGIGSANPSSQEILHFNWEYAVFSADEKVSSDLDVISTTAKWSKVPPTELHNGDRVFYRLAPEKSFNSIKAGTHKNPNTNVEYRNDYLSGPVVIQNLKRLVKPDTSLLEALSLSFVGSNESGIINEIKNIESDFSKLLNSPNAKYIVYLNGVVFDPNQATLKNGDKITVKMSPRDENVVFDVDKDISLLKNFTVSNLSEKQSKKNPAIKIVIITLTSLTVVGGAVLLAWKFLNKRKRRKI